jgi:zinc-ribbon domain
VFCSTCGTETSDDSQFCRKCGKGLAVSATSSGAGAAVAPARIPNPPKPKPLVRAPFLIAGALPLLLLIYGYNASQRANPNPAVNPIDRIVKQQRTVTVKNPALHINALNFAYFKLDVPTGATSVNLHGNFTASGGLTNDVEVFVLSADDFVNWQNRHEAKTLYNSGKVTIGTLNINLPADAGTYYLVFNNRFAILAQKTVLVDAALTYYQ